MTLADVHQFRDGAATTITRTAERISPTGVANSAAVVHPRGTVILSRTASVGFSARMGAEMAVSQDFMTWTPGRRLDGQFLLHVLRALRPQLLGLMHGSTHQTIYMPELLAIRIPFPPTVDQQRAIAEFLDRECGRIASLEARLVELAGAAHGMWLGQLAEAMGTGVGKKLRHWGARVQIGPFGSALKAGEYAAGGVPLINPVHIHWRGLRPSADIAVSASRAEDLVSWRLRAGDVVLARRGELGRAAVVSDREEGYICGTGSAVVRKVDELNPHYLVLFLLTPAARDHLALAASGATMPNLDSAAFLDLPLPARAPSEQEAVVKRVHAEYERVVRVRERLTEMSSLLMEYRDALMTEAVTGNLDVPALSDSEMDERLMAASEGRLQETV